MVDQVIARQFGVLYPSQVGRANLIPGAVIYEDILKNITLAVSDRGQERFSIYHVRERESVTQLHLTRSVT